MERDFAVAGEILRLRRQGGRAELTAAGSTRVFELLPGTRCFSMLSEDFGRSHGLTGTYHQLEAKGDGFMVLRETGKQVHLVELPPDIQLGVSYVPGAAIGQTGINIPRPIAA